MTWRKDHRNLAEPDLPRPNCRVRLVCGPPASGKSTFVRENAGRHDIVIDLDVIAREKGFGRNRPEGVTSILLKERNRRLCKLAREPQDRVAWVIVGAPSEEARSWWCSALCVAPGDLTLLVPTREELRRRIVADPDRRHVQQLHFSLVDKWFAREQHGSAHAWYKTYRWKQRRLAQLREHPLCCMCASHGHVSVATVADHVSPHRGEWNAFWLTPLQSLCAPCHSGLKQSEETLGYSKSIGVDGWPLDPKHPVYRQQRVQKQK